MAEEFHQGIPQRSRLLGCNIRREFEHRLGANDRISPAPLNLRAGDGAIAQSKAENAGRAKNQRKMPPLAELVLPGPCPPRSDARICGSSGQPRSLKSRR